jgi:DNA-binding transcriptional MerR regulator
VNAKLYKAAEVCELLQVQPYVLRSWEKEFPGIGVRGKSPEGPRLYRQSDLEHVQRIKQLVFVEGLTVAGARRKLEASAPPIAVVSESEAAEVLDALGADVRARIATVREGLRELHSMLGSKPGSSNGHAARARAKRTEAKRCRVSSQAGETRGGPLRLARAQKDGSKAAPSVACHLRRFGRSIVHRATCCSGRGLHDHRSPHIDC